MLVQVLVLLLLTAPSSEAKRKSDKPGPLFPTSPATSGTVSSSVDLHTTGVSLTKYTELP
jgi:hypothetical protein